MHAAGMTYRGCAVAVAVDRRMVAVDHVFLVDLLQRFVQLRGKGGQQVGLGAPGR